LDLISQFISRYRKEFDFYEQACRMVSQVLDSNLQSAGIRAIVTSRAKNPTRLEAKVRQRAVQKSYSSVDEIYEDIVDLAGVRVALYFPAEREEVGKIVSSLFVAIAQPKEFPTSAQPSYSKRFSGYWATHYRIRLPESLLNESQKRYSDAKVEIQVASVLMHAWSEVEHDLVYKPLQGKLSREEYSILDELNGLVIAGEIALERLQRAGELRVSRHDREYTNHYDLASSLLELSRDQLSGQNIHESLVGRVDFLFELLKSTNLNTPERLQKYISALHTDFEKRPLSEQIIDQILAEDPERYAKYNSIRSLDASNLPYAAASNYRRTHQTTAIGDFMALWIEYEQKVRGYVSSQGIKPLTPVMPLLKSVNGVPPDLIESAERLRKFRNQLVHGIEVPDAEFINAQKDELQSLISRLNDIFTAPNS
jgi:ppGpp synthetase/RelA/SpoT-type nucleotidyltranferase